MNAAAHRVLPGFRLTLGYTLLYLSLLVLLPLTAVFIETAGMGLAAPLRLHFMREATRRE